MDKIKGLYIVNTVISVLLLIGFITMFIVFNNSMSSLMNSNGEATETVDASTVDMKDIEILSIDDPIIVNIKSSKEDEENHTMRIQIRLALNKKANEYKTVKENLEKNKDIIVSDTIEVMRKKTYEEVERTNSSEVLNKELTKMINQKWNTSAVINIVFKEYITQ